MRPRTTVARRALHVLLFLGGFLTLAFILGGQAHADTPASPFSSSTASSTSSSASPAATAGRTTVEHAAATLTSRAQQAGKSLTSAVAQVGSVTRTVRPLSLLLGTVQGAAQQVVSPLVDAATGLTCPGHAAKSAPNAVGHTAVRPHSAGRTALTARVGRTAATAHGTAAHHALAAHQQQAPGSQAPVPADHSSDHPVEGDGGFHHSGDTHAALLSGGVRFPLCAAVIGTAHGSSPVMRSTNVSVQPD
ncbi:hypothetical protein NGB36_22220 [Streptomyces sp. RB6PN25]|uniref:Uncharacterized protein n=1 Tax=Streptomyces humicola TaxID=2953240 RepID=A0ABT1Q1K4_9ACTN|nr:hypothetical protein [Streptomyces humicola]MCQ4083243.1 hypothetical protein [Streptomyces humicola]